MDIELETEWDFYVSHAFRVLFYLSRYVYTWWGRCFLLVLITPDIVSVSQVPVSRFTAVRLEKRLGQCKSTGFITQYKLRAISLIFDHRQYLVLVAWMMGTTSFGGVTHRYQ